MSERERERKRERERVWGVIQKEKKEEEEEEELYIERQRDTLSTTSHISVIYQKAPERQTTH